MEPIFAILPCAHCSSPGDVMHHAPTEKIEKESFMVVCPVCKCRTSWYDTPMQAIMAWNLRPEAAHHIAGCQFVKIGTKVGHLLYGYGTITGFRPGDQDNREVKFASGYAGWVSEDQLYCLEVMCARKGAYDSDDRKG